MNHIVSLTLHPQRTLDNDRMVLAVEERVEELIALFEREAYRLAPLKGADVSGTPCGRMQRPIISHPIKTAGIFSIKCVFTALKIRIRFEYQKYAV
jgi:hypothetical protein